MSDSAENPSPSKKVKFKNLHPGERFSYVEDHERALAPVYVKTSGHGAVDCNDRALSLTFEHDNTSAEVYAVDRTAL